MSVNKLPMRCFVGTRSDFLWCLGAGAALGVVYYVAKQAGFANGYLHPFFPLMVLFYVLQSLFVLYMWRARAPEVLSFARMGFLMMLRMFSAFVLFCVLFWWDVGNAYVFAANFFFLYLLYLSLDVVFLSRR